MPLERPPRGGAAQSPADPQSEATTLAIRLWEGGRQLLDMQVPAAAIRSISALLPAVLESALARAGVDLKQLEARYRGAQLRPGRVLARVFPESGQTLLLYLS